MDSLRSLSDQIAALVERVSPAVGHVRTLHRQRSQLGGGSCAVVSADGLTLTNSHVVRGATVVEVELEEGAAELADVLGDDPFTDLALLRLSRARASPGGRSPRSRTCTAC